MSMQQLASALPVSPLLFSYSSSSRQCHAKRRGSEAYRHGRHARGRHARWRKVGLGHVHGVVASHAHLCHGVQHLQGTVYHSLDTASLLL